MTLHTLESTATRAVVALLRRTLVDLYLPGEDALESYQPDVRGVLDLLDDLDAALLRLEITLARTTRQRRLF